MMKVNIYARIFASFLNTLALTVALCVSGFAGEAPVITGVASDGYGRLVLTETASDHVRVRVLDHGVETAVDLVGEVAVAGQAVTIDGRVLVAGTFTARLVAGDRFLVAENGTAGFVLVIEDGFVIDLFGLVADGAVTVMSVGLDAAGEVRLDGLVRAEGLTHFAVVVDGDGYIVDLVTNELDSVTEAEAAFDRLERSGGEETDPEGGTPGNGSGDGSGTPGSTGSGGITAETDALIRVIEAIVLGHETLDLRVMRR